MTAWIVVANSSRARLFSAQLSKGPIEEIVTLVDPEGRAHEQNLTSDLPGRTYDRAGQGRHTKEGKVGTKQHRHIDFAGRVANRLEAGRANHKYRHLFIISAPAFLGLIRAKVSRGTAACVVSWIDKDLTLLSDEEIRKHLPEKLW